MSSERSLGNIMMFGYPRSGTTWIAEILSASGELTYLHEPDNERINIHGLYHKFGGRRFPIAPKGRDMVGLFRRSLNGYYLSDQSRLSTYPLAFLKWTPQKLERYIGSISRSKKLDSRVKLGLLKNLMRTYRALGVAKLQGPFLVKSVHSGLMLERFIQSPDLDFQPLIVLRHPAAIIRSMKTMKNPDLYRGIEKNPNLSKLLSEDKIRSILTLRTPLEKIAMQISIHHHLWHEWAMKYDIKTIKHEDLLVDPKEGFKTLYQDLGLHFTPRVERLIDQKNKGGAGYKTNRNSKSLIGKWKGFFSQDELDQIRRGYMILPTPFYSDFSKD
ncbi:MAG: sulfotransferase domain-containing protein [Bacteroidota bacterium]|nr:sulfotransferase domain-containing protein [Bacteroidota bacterium]MDX5506917.1 sulfotransferase domain-containing protein [Bacteroidota bacterium]